MIAFKNEEIKLPLCTIMNCGAHPYAEGTLLNLVAVRASKRDRSRTFEAAASLQVLYWL
jgi:hypothetical protein